MRYLRAARMVRSLANTVRRKQFNVEEMSDYMRRDIGLIDGASRRDKAFVDGDGRSRRLDLLILTPFAS